MPTSAPNVFLSYSRTDEAWVKALHRNLLAISEHGRMTSGRVFFDEVEIVPGHSWVRRLDKGLAESERLVLVVSPESLSSPWVNKELEAMLAKRPNWPGRSIVPVLLRWTPLPTLLPDQYADFRNHDDATYREQLAKLIAGLRDAADLTTLPELPEELEIPAYPTDPLGEELRREVVGWLQELLDGYELLHDVVARKFGVELALLKELPADRAAAAVVVEVTDDQDPPHSALMDHLAPLLSAGLSKFDRDLADRLEELLQQLEAATPPPLPAADNPSPLSRWLELVREDTEQVDSFLKLRMEGPPSLLNTLYVKRTVAERQPEAQAEGQRGGDRPRSPEDLHRHPEQTLEDLLAAPSPTHRWVLLGEPGAGKTTLLRHLAWSCATRDDLPWIPILVSIAEAVGSDAWLTEWIESTYRERKAPEGLGEFLDSAAREEDSRVLVLLDGLDEIAAERRPAAHRWLKSLVNQWPHARFVVSSRPAPYEPLGDGFEELEVQPLSPEARVELVARYLSRREEPQAADVTTAEEHLARLERDAWLAEWVGNPLYLTFLALLLRKGQWPSSRRDELYRQVIDLLLRGEHRPDANAMEPIDATRSILACLAHGMTADEPEIRSGDIQKWLLAEELEEHVRALKTFRHRYHEDLGAFIEDLKATGLLAPYAAPEWRFLHRTFREALAAEHMATLAKTEEGWAEVVRHAGGLAAESGEQRDDLSRWGEPYVLLVGQIDDPDGLLLALMKSNRVLGLRSLAGAHGLRVETVRTVLEAAEEWGERMEVFRAVPRVVGAPEEALRFLDEVREHTRDGNDLFWIDWAVRELGRQHPELEEAVDELLGRFFDHIPPPPEELFTRVETPVDGVVPLWCKVPQGEFRMGSPEDEDGRYGDEGPQHLVEMQSGFHMAAVPVTRAQYAAFDPEHQSYGFDGIAEDELAHHPVNSVTWWAAMAFCRWLSQAFPETAGARLPTEAEWEYACRAGRRTAYWSGEDEEDLDRVGWFDDNSEGRTHRVGEKPANPWGLYDVHGNVWEWTVSPWTDDYADREGGVVADPAGVAIDDEIGADPDGGRRVFRGGSCWYPALWARSAYRGRSLPGFGWHSLGFRVLLPAAPSGGS